MEFLGLLAESEKYVQAACEALEGCGVARWREGLRLWEAVREGMHERERGVATP